ncbi:Protein CBG05525 [Caenorhabditis briggsae]|uniref:Protein CBG05525 n=1 Tax=Caenorhabditis briggsae TaxID=6238 RepID=A8X030_CAEBR|nr:Protein CBG05525 [Caenorhabditis briggsae]CAP25990.1 Protein CBG05525 [Caenorhabditis briggsae]
MSRPAGPWVGGVSDLNATLYTCEAWKTVPEINEKNDGEFYVVPIKVLKAQRQVVSGFRTTLEILVGESERPKESLPVDLITAANSLLKDNGQRAVYRVAISEKGRNFRKVTAEKVRDVKPSEEF